MSVNYIKHLQAEKAEAIDAARTIETEINDILNYLCCSKFHVEQACLHDVVLTLALLEPDQIDW